MTEEQFVAINKRLDTMQDFLEEVHRIVQSLHEQWNAPSGMDIPLDALKEKTPIGETPKSFRETDPLKVYR